MKKQLIIASAFAPLFLSSIGQGYAAFSESTGSLATTASISQTVTLGTLPTYSTIAGSLTGATSLTVNTGSDITFNPAGDIRVTLPASTVVTPATGTGFDLTALTTASATVTTGLGENESSNGAVEFGISSVGLHFDKPIKVEIPVPGVTASTITVKVKHGGSSSYVTTGLTNSSSATCTSGVPSVASNVATVTNGVATIYSCAASTFVAYSTATPSSGSSAGAGGAGANTANYPIMGGLLSGDSDLVGELLNSAPLENFINLDDLLFEDIDGNWAMDYIQKLAQRGIVNNTTTFNPEGELTRAEFIKMALNTSGDSLDDTLQSEFDDVTSSHSLGLFVANAVKKGIVDATSDLFRPDDSITRAEAMKILMNVLDEGVLDTEESSFSDVDPSLDLAKYIEAAAEMGIVSGQEIDGKTYFRPNDSITRAEIAKVLANAFKL